MGIIKPLHNWWHYKWKPHIVSMLSKKGNWKEANIDLYDTNRGYVIIFYVLTFLILVYVINTSSMDSVVDVKTPTESFL